MQIRTAVGAILAGIAVATAIASEATVSADIRDPNFDAVLRSHGLPSGGPERALGHDVCAMRQRNMPADLIASRLHQAGADGFYTGRSVVIVNAALSSYCPWQR